MNIGDKPAPVHMDVVVIGGGQAGLATGFYLRRSGMIAGRDFVILDAARQPGGSWPRMWDGLRLFSPASASSLPGWMMPPWNDRELGYPPRDHVVQYLTRYEERYDLQVMRPMTVSGVFRGEDESTDRLIVRTSQHSFASRAVVSATGIWDQPFWPTYPGMRQFRGRQLHAAQYRRPEDFAGKRVVIVGGGNSAAQILAEVSTVAETTWVTRRAPRFLPDDIDGRALFATARARLVALEEGRDHAGVAGLGDIVMVDSVRDARERGKLTALPMFERLTERGIAWSDGTLADVDVVIWCTGFRPALHHLRPLHLSTHGGRVVVGGESGTQARDESRLFLVGYGDWTGPASATLTGVSPSARSTARVITEHLHAGDHRN